jgi:SAM-dependent methyltransferase
MFEAVLIAIAFTAIQWMYPPWSLIIACSLLLLCLPGVLTMRGAAPYVTTSKKTMEAMLRLANIQHGDHIYDLGCGDGRIVFAAAAHGALAVGYEVSIPTYLLAKIRSLWHPRSNIRYGNLWKQNYGDADVIFCYFLKDTMQDFALRIWPTLKPGCRVVSHAFTIDGMEAAARDGDAVLYVKG